MVIDEEIVSPSRNFYALALVVLMVEMVLLSTCVLVRDKDAIIHEHEVRKKYVEECAKSLFKDKDDCRKEYDRK